MAVSLEPKVTFRQELFVPLVRVTVGNMETNSTVREFATRFNEVCDDMKVPPKGKNRQAKVAQIFKVSQKGARKWLEGEGLPTLTRCVEIAKWGNVGLEWLVCGRGLKKPELLQLDDYSNKMLAIMQTLPEYLKPTAVRQVNLLGELQQKTGDDS